MRWVALVTLAACGRIGFDARGDGGTNEDGTDAIADGMLVQDDCTEPGLLLYLAFDEPDGMMALDSSGNGHHGSLAGFSSTTRIAGKKGTALRFDGVDDRVDIRVSTALDNLRRITACAWAALDPGNRPQRFSTIVDKSLDGLAEGWNLYFRHDTGDIGFFTNADAYVEGGVISDSVWQYVCGAWDGTAGSAGIDVFLDGIALPVDASSEGMTIVSDADHAMTIGQSTSGEYQLLGSIDELRIYDHVLGASEVQALLACSQ